MKNVIPDADAAAAMEAMKNQLIIVLVEMLGGEAIVPVADLDNTTGKVMLLRYDGTDKSFHFVVESKER